jgi:hypothetical protein
MKINRRNFLKIIGVTCGALALNPLDTIMSFEGVVVKELSWRDEILTMYPNEGMSPLMELLKEGKLERVDDPNFSWWSK